ncbi:flavin-containing monooxygenase [Amycolatopsis echigonensis]|uniref:NAD(P)/FAD-dependent oxidoreductase n=1 Tax=Amycolatopsis echigonensis TaxID=2576905 RepID=A0A8E1W634_9PSEU|nr:NAD(P)/FAD-dependent oxidoreductase [Amycolatopsis echigonensis]MBB2504576.1 NAD(P)/FAD-dependent oxidoreductase [Amycolatopsis echigonensis]
MKERSATERADIVVIGAGVSGIGASRQLAAEFPDKKILVLESRAAIGGTWDLFRYPGVRSDSDLHTYAYDFKPWRHRSAIAEAPLIREYLDETVAEFGLDKILRLGHRVTAADWSSAEAQWTLQVRVTGADGAESEKTVKAGFVFSATGYYRYDKGYTPHFEGREVFRGDILHPQEWPEDYDYRGKRVVIIGSGATAVTMLPAMLMGEGAAAHVTMLQRTPSYVASAPRVDKIALALSKVLGAKAGYAATRRKNIWQDFLLVSVLTKFPNFGRKLLRKLALKDLPPGFDVDTHFNPPYDPWDQRLCVTPDGEFFHALRDGKADVVTDRIDRFTEKGILLESGKTLEADLVVTATGLALQLLGGIQPTVDGVPAKLPDTVLYRGCLISGVPNWAMMFGYTKASWTLRLSNVCRLVADVLRRMDATGQEIVVPVAPENLAKEDVVDLSAGYLRRSLHELPKQGTELPWRMRTTFVPDNRLFKGQLIDESLRFSTRTSTLAGVGAGS